ncbi:MAG: hypothetical protein ABW133_10160 [Polyangiaceae bacterium]
MRVPGVEFVLFAATAIDLLAVIAIVQRFRRRPGGNQWVRPSRGMIALAIALAVFPVPLLGAAAAFLHVHALEGPVDPSEKARQLAESIAHTMNATAVILFILCPPAIAVLWQVYRR